MRPSSLEDRAKQAKHRRRSPGMSVSGKTAPRLRWHQRWPPGHFTSLHVTAPVLMGRRTQIGPRNHRAEAWPENGEAKSWASGIPPALSCTDRAMRLHVFAHVGLNRCVQSIQCACPPIRATKEAILEHVKSLWGLRCHLS